MLKIFKRTKEDEVYSPVAGTCIKIEDVKDQMFANKLLGDGIAILPSKETIYAPIDGQLIMLANTKHAFGIKNKRGLEILVHVGLDSVKLKGKGFTVYKELHEHVRKGEAILSFDQALFEQEQIDMTVLIIITSKSVITHKTYGQVSSAHNHHEDCIVIILCMERGEMVCGSLRN